MTQIAPKVVAQPTTKRFALRENSILRAIVTQPKFWVGFIILVFWLVDSLAWHLISPYSPQALDLSHVFHSPTLAHPFGTDNYGRDVLSRTLSGAGSVLVVGAGAALIGVVLGSISALIIGYYGGIVDNIFMRSTEALLAIPLIIFAAMAISVFGTSPITVIIVTAFVFTPVVARSIRIPVQAEATKDYIKLARLRGENSFFILFREILPNVLGQITVETTVRVGYGIFLTATLSFLGLGLQPPSTNWGLAIAQGQAYLQSGWWIVLFPAICLASLVVAFNFISEATKRAVEGR